MYFINKNKIKLFSLNKKIFVIFFILLINGINICLGSSFDRHKSCSHDKCINLKNNIKKFDDFQRSILLIMMGHVLYKKIIPGRLSYIVVGTGCSVICSGQFFKMINYGHMKQCDQYKK